MTDKANGNRTRGRPSKYTVELAIEICDRMGQGESARQICKDEHMPDASALTRWGQTKNVPEIWFEGETAETALSFSQRYARAEELGLQMMRDEMHEIAADGSNDWIDREVKAGRLERSVDHEHVNRSKLRVDTIKWDLAKRHPDYADKLKHEHSGPGGGPIETKLAATAFLDKLSAAVASQPPEDETEG